MRIAGLVRVSSSKQAAEGTSSPKVQRQGILAACKTLGFPPPVDWYEGVESGVGIKPREQFERLLSDCVRADCQWDAVMVYEPTRWTRSPEDGARAIRTLLSTRPRKKFFVRERDMRIDRAAGRAAMGYAGQAAFGEADSLRERIMDNKWEKANDEGRWCVVPPWGFRLQDGKLIVLPGAKATAQRAYDLIVRKNYGLPKVAKALGHGNGTQWHERIRGRFYPALDRWVGGMCIPGFVLQHPETGELKAFDFPDAPRLLSVAQLAAIKKRWAANSTKTGQLPGGYVYLLRHKVKCECGSTLGGVPRKRDGKKTRNEYRHADSEKESDACVNAVLASKLESDVFWELRELLQRPDLPAIIERGNLSTLTSPDFDGLLAAAKAELAKVTKEKRTLLTNTKLSEKLLDKRSMHDFADMAQELSDKQTEIESRIAQLEREQDLVVNHKDDAARTAAILRQLAAHPNRWSADNKRILLDCLFGAENVKGRDQGIFVGKLTKANGRCDYPIRFHFVPDLELALQHVAGQVTPEELGRPRIRQTPSDTTNTST